MSQPIAHAKPWIVPRPHVPSWRPATHPRQLFFICSIKRKATIFLFLITSTVVTSSPSVFLAPYNKPTLLISGHLVYFSSLSPSNAALHLCWHCFLVRVKRSVKRRIARLEIMMVRGRKASGTIWCRSDISMFSGQVLMRDSLGLEGGVFSY